MKKINIKYSPRAVEQSASLASIRQRYETLKKEIQALGFVCLGSVSERWVVCGRPNCACHNDDNQRHGPYFYWSSKIEGKTQSRMLTKELVKKYRNAIENHRKFSEIIHQMREVSLTALDNFKVAEKAG